MNNVTAEQIQQAKQLDLLTYLQSREPDNIRLVGREYRLRDHDSLTVSNGKFHWHSQGIGGSNCIDYLVKVRGYCFVEAVQSLVGANSFGVSDVTANAFTANAVPASVPPIHLTEQDKQNAKDIQNAQDTKDTKEQKPPAAQERKQRVFVLPARNVNNDGVIAYLKWRGIALRIINACIERGQLYEDARHNCVFVGFDGGGIPRYAALRGTYGDFKGEVYGSDKRFSFLLPPVNLKSPIIAVFESAVDALAHATLRPEFSGCRLSLGGVSLTALAQFLTFHGNINYIYVCTDNDETGDACAERIARLHKRIRALREKPPIGKDWADCLR